MEGTESRKRSPRAPSMALGEAIERALKIYEAEGKHPAPVDVVAKHLGYKTAGSGSAATALASLRYYGLLDRPKEGFLAASRDLEEYKFAPDEKVKAQLLANWLRSPPLFADLLSTYPENLPSDSNLKFDLIRRGFNPGTADECVKAFKDSVSFVQFFEQATPSATAAEIHVAAETQATEAAQPSSQPVPVESLDRTADKIPIRLTGGRRAWLIVPTPFYESDKKRLIAQIDLLLTDEDGEQK